MSPILMKGWLHICLAMLFLSEGSSENCSSLRVQLRTANKNNLELLKNRMRTNLPLQCLSEIIDSTAIQESRRGIQTSLKTNPKVAMLEIYQQIMGVFIKNVAETAWDENSIAVLQSGLHQLVQHLGTCLITEMDSDSPVATAQNIQLTKLRVKRYFHRIDDFLKEKQHSLCAWEIVQIEVTQCFLLVNQLTNWMPN